MSIYMTRPHKDVDAPKLPKYLKTVRNLDERGGDWRSHCKVPIEINIGKQLK